MYANKDQGGLYIPNIQYQYTSHKIACVKRLVCQSESDGAKLDIMLTYDQLCAKYQVNMNFMQISSVVSAFPGLYKYNRNVSQSLNQAHLI